MQFGPIFGGIAVVLTWPTTNLFVLGGTRLLEGASTAASVPSILGFIAASPPATSCSAAGPRPGSRAPPWPDSASGLVAAGPLYQVFGREAFLLNAVIYAVSFCIYRFGVDPADELGRGARMRPTAWRPSGRTRLGRLRRLLRSSSVLVLAPTWIAINAAIGLWTTQSIFNLVKSPTRASPTSS